MAEPKFTPGPWRAANNNPLIIGIAVPGRTYAVAKAYANLGSESAANARLIAAAPELYQMTELLERSVVYEIKKSESEGDDEGARMKSFTLSEVRAALAKARGETP